MNARIRQGLHLFCRRSLSASDDRACMAHATTGRRGLSGDESNDWFFHMLFRKGRSLFFGRASDLTDHHNAICLIVILEQTQRVEVRGADNWIAADSDRRRLAQ